MPLYAVLALAAATAAPDPTTLYGVWMMCDRGLQYMEETDPRGDPNLRMLLTPDGRVRLGWPDPAGNPPEAARSGRYTYRDGHLALEIDGRSTGLDLRGDGATLIATAATGLETRLCPLGQDAAQLERPVPAYSLTAVITVDGEVANRLPQWRPPPTPPTASGTDGVWEIVRIVAPARADMPPYGYPTRKLVLRGEQVCVLRAEDTRVDAGRCRPLADIVDPGERPVRTGAAGLLLRHAGSETHLRWIGPDRDDIPVVPTRIVLLETADAR